MTDEERQLIQKAANGDKEALGRVLENYGPAIQAALNISPTWQRLVDSADVMQVTYLEAFTRIRAFDPDRADAFPSWLRQMAENNLRDALRALEAKKHPSPRHQVEAHAATDSAVALFETLSSGSGTPSRAARRNEAEHLLAEAMRCLPADYSRTVQLYDLEARPVEDVAAALGRSVGAVYMLRMRAHDRLRDLLGEASRVLESRA